MKQAAKKGHGGLDRGNTYRRDEITQVRRVGGAQPRAFT